MLIAKCFLKNRWFGNQGAGGKIRNAWDVLLHRVHFCVNDHHGPGDDAVIVSEKIPASIFKTIFRPGRAINFSLPDGVP
jgi:hypothetical protein